MLMCMRKHVAIGRRAWWLKKLKESLMIRSWKRAELKVGKRWIVSQKIAGKGQKDVGASFEQQERNPALIPGEITCFKESNQEQGNWHHAKARVRERNGRMVWSSGRSISQFKSSRRALWWSATGFEGHDFLGKVSGPGGQSCNDSVCGSWVS